MDLVSVLTRDLARANRFSSKTLGLPIESGGLARFADGRMP